MKYHGLKQPFPGMPEPVEGRGFAGIQLANYLDFNVFGNNVQDVTDGNTFTQLANGIVGFNTTMNIGNMHFSNMNAGGTAYDRYGYGIYLEGRNNSSWANINQPWLPPMTFTNCNTAIRAIRYAGKIENCDISESDSGVEWERSPLRDVRIRDNVIETRQFGVSSFLNEPLNAVSSISDNQVRVSNTGAGANPAVALKINEGGYGTILGSGWSITGNQISTENGGRVT